MLSFGFVLWKNMYVVGEERQGYLRVMGIWLSVTSPRPFAVQVMLVVK